MARLTVMLLFVLAACTSDAPPAIEPPPLETIAEVKLALEPLLAGFPETPTVEVNDDLYIAKYDTMMFRIHGIDKAGRIGRESREMEGPNSRGFLLRVTRAEGEYRGAAVLPQTFERPYWKTFGNAIASRDGRSHLHVSFSYGRRVNADFRDAVLRLFSDHGSQQSR